MNMKTYKDIINACAIFSHSLFDKIMNDTNSIRVPDKIT